MNVRIIYFLSVFKLEVAHQQVKSQFPHGYYLEVPHED